MDTRALYRTARDWYFDDFDHVDLNLILEARDFDRWEFIGLDDYGEVSHIDPPIRYTVYKPRQPVDSIFYLMNSSHIIRELGFGFVFHNKEFYGLTVNGVGFDIIEPYFAPLYQFRYQEAFNGYSNN